MNDISFELITYYLISVIFIVAILNIIQYVRTNTYKNKISEFEFEKNKVIGAPIITELSKVELLAKNETIENRVQGWQDRFDLIKNNEIVKINDLLLEADFLLEGKNYRDLIKKFSTIEMKLYETKSRINHILDEIKEITLSEEKNRQILTDLKTKYRDLLQKFISSKEEYGEVIEPLELQFENIERRFQDFETAMEANDYDEISYIVRAIDEMLKHMEIIIEEIPTILLTINMIIPKRISEIKETYQKLVDSDYQLGFLNVEYNIDEINKKLSDIKDHVKVLNLENVLLDIKTFVEYFDNLFNDFDEEKQAKKNYEDMNFSFKEKIKRVNKLLEDFYSGLDLLKSKYTLSEKDINYVNELKEDFNKVSDDYKSLIDTTKTKVFPYSKLFQEMEGLSLALIGIEERVESIISSLGSMKNDEKRAKEQLADIKEFLMRSKKTVRTYKLPSIPNSYYIELKDVIAAIKEVEKELDKKPINIDVLNTRVDTARDLVLKLYNNTKETVKMTILAEMAIVYGNRYKSSKLKVEETLNKAEIYFSKGEYKKALEMTINVIDMVEPGFYRNLLSLYENYN
ncbi:MAG: septation ring formation regulator EzrA [Bacilli bacterium]|jgi:septation ring formation regulator